MTVTPRPVIIQYRRLPNRLGSFQGILRLERKDMLIIEHRVRMRAPQRVFGRVSVADKYLALWFIFRDKWYDVGKFYDRRGNFTGYYCDIIRPIARLMSDPLKTSVITDLFLDLWISRDGKWRILDEDEFQTALTKRTLSPSLGRRARKELAALIRATEAGRFPPRSVRTFRGPTNCPRS